MRSETSACAWVSLRGANLDCLRLNVKSCRFEPVHVALESSRGLGGDVDCPVMLKIDTDHKVRPRGGLLPLGYSERPSEHPGRETMRMITSLPAEALPLHESRAMYGERWGIETQYRFFKGQDHLPVVLSRKSETVRQEVLVRVMAHNRVRRVQAEAGVTAPGSPMAAAPPPQIVRET